MKSKYLAKGFTLIELLLVMVIVSSFIYMGTNYLQDRTQQMRIDKTVLQMQQVLNAGLSYYVANGSWPTMAQLQSGSAYIPATFRSPWAGASYTVSSTTQLFKVTIPLPAMKNQAAVSVIIAGRLPLSSMTAQCSTASTAGCTVTASVNIPGQNLNNATAVNFAGLYHHGACVPVPKCPVDANGVTMTPQIFVVPVSISGVNDTDSTNVYPISSFTAYALGSGTPPSGNPPNCNTADPTPPTRINTPNETCMSLNNNGYWEIGSASAYWRVCLQVITSKGDVSATNQGTSDFWSSSDYWGKYATLAAFTRCAISNEPSGSALVVYGN